MSFLFSVCMYFSSFMPLWIAILFIDTKNCLISEENLNTEAITIILIILMSVVSSITLYFFMRNKKQGGVHTYVIKEVQEEKVSTAEFLLSYLLPLFAFDFTKWDQCCLFFMIFFMLGILHIKHNYFSVNIVFEFLKYCFYDCTIVNDDGVDLKTVIISRRNLCLETGNLVQLKAINNECRLDFTSSVDRIR